MIEVDRGRDNPSWHLGIIKTFHWLVNGGHDIGVKINDGGAGISKKPLAGGFFPVDNSVSVGNSQNLAP